MSAEIPAASRRRAVGPYEVVQGPSVPPGLPLRPEKITCPPLGWNRPDSTRPLTDRDGNGRSIALRRSPGSVKQCCPCYQNGRSEQRRALWFLRSSVNRPPLSLHLAPGLLARLKHSTSSWACQFGDKNFLKSVFLGQMAGFRAGKGPRAVRGCRAAV